VLLPVTATSPAAQTEIFDPAALRAFSLLPNADADEAYCARHDREMKAIRPVVHTEGALYTTAENFSAYTCPRCLAEVAQRLPARPIDVYRGHLSKAFGQWDRDEAPGDWFRYLCEGTRDDVADWGVTT
jgi:hypothetical protein